MRLDPVTKSEERKIRALSLRRQGLTFEEIGKHPDIGPISRTRAMQLVQSAGAIVRCRVDRLRVEIGSNRLEDLDLSVRARNCLRNPTLDLRTYRCDKCGKHHLTSQLDYEEETEAAFARFHEAVRPETVAEIIRELEEGAA